MGAWSFDQTGTAAQLECEVRYLIDSQLSRLPLSEGFFAIVSLAYFGALARMGPLDRRYRLQARCETGDGPTVHLVLDLEPETAEGEKGRAG